MSPLAAHEVPAAFPLESLSHVVLSCGPDGAQVYVDGDEVPGPALSVPAP